MALRKGPVGRWDGRSDDGGGGSQDDRGTILVQCSHLPLCISFLFLRLFVTAAT